MANTSIKRTTYGYELTTEYLHSTANNIKGIRKWSKDEVKELIKSSDKMVINSLIKLYAYQTEDEKISKGTISKNGMGFNSADANILSSIASQCYKKLFITYNQLSIVKVRILKYAGQLTKIANGEG